MMHLYAPSWQLSLLNSSFCKKTKMANNQEILCELRSKIYAAFPGIESQLTDAFRAADVAGDYTLPYSVVEALLRHFLMKCGLIEYVVQFSTSSGTLSLGYLKHALSGSSLEDLTDESGDRLVTFDEMTILAVLWLKIISDDYQESNGKNNAAMCNLGCNAGSVAESEEANYVIVEGKSGTSSIEPGIEATADVENVSDRSASTKDFGLGLLGMVSDRFESEPEQTQDNQVMEYNQNMNQLAYQEQYMQNIEGSDDQNQIDSYIKSIFDHIEQNKVKGVKCFVYPANITPDGACTSAGAIAPQRRYRARRNKERPLMGCC
ncbi:hypothetical protein BdWA1_003219 [Babesia duncani]|uniref:Uncharacterized protein n=1 Tax=Babesia duncani TaxID=323732 RepID=A0AAD9PIQ5_9APIC|nr:hypothetical protein BdWA1_003219 [Babesia duncani]